MKPVPAWLLTCLVGSTACKVAGQSGTGVERGADTPAAVERERAASATTEIRQTGKFHYLIWNQNFEMNLSKLPPAGSVESDKIPYAGGYYAEVDGGTHVGSPSPLSKYDQAFHGGTSKAVAWERANHTRSANDPDADWAGHCNGFSAASQRHAEPRLPVTRDGVTFQPHDIKALLAEIYMSAKSVFLGGRRCESRTFQTRPTSRQDVTVMGECEDVNPASFHLAIANWIGVLKHALVFDQSENYQVWNFPLFAYESTITRNLSASQALGYIGTSGNNYVFNPNATEFAHVTTTVSYQAALRQEPRTYPTRSVKRLTYRYVLELDGSGNVIGGEWDASSQGSHPDFVWVALEPVSGNGNKSLANPHVDPKTVISLWAESIGANPNNPPLDIMEPIWQTNWGRFPGFDVELDGGTSGAVYLGKKAKLVLNRKEGLHGDVEVSIAINSKVVKSVRASGTGPIAYEFEPIAGLNRLAFIWKKGGTEVDRSFLRFDVMP